MFPRVAVGIVIFFFVGIATIAVIGAVRFKHMEDEAKRERVASDTAFFRQQLEAYRVMNGSLPSTEQGLRALVEKPTGSPQPAHWQQLSEGVVSDPWNTPYIYRCPGMRHPNGYDLFSAGRDGKPDTTDDVWTD